MTAGTLTPGEITEEVTTGGHVLDPFAGSGTTLLAALTEGMTAHGVEREPDHVNIIRARLTAPAPVVLF